MVTRKKSAVKAPVVPAVAGKSAHKAKRTNRGSRNKKKNAKKIDLEDVHEHLEDVRHQERTGGIISDKSDDQLFVIETSGEGSTLGEKPRVLSKKERARNKVLYNDQALVPNPHIKEVASRQGTGKRSRAVENANGGGISEAYQRPQPYKAPLKRRKGGKGKDNGGTLVVPEEDGSMTVNVAVSTVTPKDAKLWERPSPELKEEDKNPWLKSVKDFKAAVKPPKKNAQRQLPSKEVSTVPAVEVPDSGVSYNPSFSAHQQALSEALKEETARLAERKKVEAELPIKMNAREKDKARLAELSVGLLEDAEDDESDDGNASDETTQPLRKPVVRAENRKTRQQLNKQKRHQERVLAMEKMKKQKQMENDVYKLRSLKKELTAHEKKMQQREEIKKEKSKAALAEPRKLGSQVFRKPKAVFQLSEELTGTLRGAKTVVDPVKERFLSMQKRNQLEVREPVKRRRRYRLKEYTKRSYKNYDLREEQRLKQKEFLAQRAAAQS
eukprot:m.15773 g.15773  ORF g.15773 m.15773 type:complete len:498 (-) comp10816_c0_seq2:3160-4653(-)